MGKVDQRNRLLNENTCNDTQSHSRRIVLPSLFLPMLNRLLNQGDDEVAVRAMGLAALRGLPVTIGLMF